MIMKNISYKNKKTLPVGRQGFTLAIVLILISVILIVGLSVSDIVLREMKISGLGRESQKAFYAAETGIECALKWFLVSEFPASIKCGGSVIAINGGPAQFNLNLSNNSCTNVAVIKNIISSTKTQFIIESRGHSMACGSTSFNNAERGLRETITITTPSQ